MIVLAVPLTIGLSLTHPEIFGTAWYLLIMLCIGMSIHTWGSRSTSAPIQCQEPSREFLDLKAWNVWLLAFGPLTVISIVSVIAYDLRLGRAEAIEVFLGGLLFTTCFELRRLKLGPSALPTAAIIAAPFGLLLTLYEYIVLGISRTGDEFVSINFGIGCGALLIIALGWTALRGTSAHHFHENPQPKTPWNNPWIMGATVLGLTLALLGSGSRGPITAFILCVSLVFIVPSIRTKLHLANPRLLLFFGLLMLVFLCGAGFIFVPRFLEAFHGGAQSSDGIRWQLILIALEQIEKTPWFGIGADQASRLYATFPPPISDLNHVHVTLLNIALELGLLGGLSWVWAFGVLAMVFSPWRPSNQSLVSILGFLICTYLFACSMTQDVMSHSYTRKYIALVIPLLLTIHLTSREKYAEKHN